MTRVVLLGLWALTSACGTSDEAGEGAGGGPDLSGGLGVLSVTDGRFYEARSATLSFDLGPPTRGLIGMVAHAIDRDGNRVEGVANTTVAMDEAHLLALGRNERVPLVEPTDTVGVNAGMLTFDDSFQFGISALRLSPDTSSAALMLEIELAPVPGESGGLSARYRGQLPLNCTWTAEGGTVRDDPRFSTEECAGRLDQLGLRDEHEVQLGL